MKKLALMTCLLGLAACVPATPDPVGGMDILEEQGLPSTATILGATAELQAMPELQGGPCRDLPNRGHVCMSMEEYNRQRGITSTQDAQAYAGTLANTIAGQLAQIR